MIRPSLLGTILFLLVAWPTSAFAQAYVPVIDINMAKQFPGILRDDPDSIRNIIAGPDPGGVSQEECVETQSRYIDVIDWYDANSIAPDPNIPNDVGGGPWFRARSVLTPDGNNNGDEMLPDPEFFKGGVPDQTPAEIGRTVPLARDGNTNGNEGRVVHSSSLRCLLISLIEWQKLSINVQIHAMLRDYIAQAQNYMLQEKLLGEMQGAVIEGQKRGSPTCRTDPDGNVRCQTRPSYIPNEEEFLTSRASDQVNGLAEKIGGNNLSPQGSTLVNPLWQIDTQRDVLTSNRRSTEDPRTLEEDAFRWSSSIDVDPDAPFLSNEVSQYYSAGGGWSPELAQGDGMQALSTVLGNPGASPLVTASFADAAARRRVTEEQDRVTRKLEQGEGFMDTEVCTDENDPWCAQKTSVTPGSINQNLLSSAVQESEKTARSSQGANQYSSDPKETLTTDIMASGVSGYQTKKISEDEAQARLNATLAELPRELVRTAYWGYWNTPLGLSRWTQATMLTIYDELIQVPKSDVITAPGYNASDTGENADSSGVDIENYSGYQ